MEIPTYEQVQDWHSLPVTKYVIEMVNDDIRRLQEAWAEGSFTAESADETAQLNARALGSIQALYNLLDVLDSLAEVETSYEDEA